MKIAVYGITTGHQQGSAERWAQSCSEADYRVLLDTGVSRKTSKTLQSLGVSVIRNPIGPFCFDAARNAALAAVPGDADLCVSLDLDEVLSPGWRDVIENSWTAERSRAKALHILGWEEDGSTPRELKYSERIHSRQGYRWKHAVGECLSREDLSTGATDEPLVLEQLRIFRFGDSRNRQEFEKKVLKRALRDAPDEPALAFLHGEMLFKEGRYDKSLTALQTYLKLPKALQPGNEQERAMAMRLIAFSHKKLGHSLDEIVQFLYKAAAESPGERESWGFLALEFGKLGNWPNCLAAAVNALRVTDASQSFRIEHAFWNGALENLIELASRALKIKQPQEAR